MSATASEKRRQPRFFLLRWIAIVILVSTVPILSSWHSFLSRSSSSVKCHLGRQGTDECATALVAKRRRRIGAANTPGGRNETTTATIGSDAGTERTSFHDELWNNLSDRLCPNLSPDLRLGHALFELARKEVEVPSTRWHFPALRRHKRTTDSSRALEGIFFHGFFVTHKTAKPILYKNGSDTFALIYIPIWKSANNQIRFWIDEAFPHQSNNDEVSLKEIVQSIERENWRPCFVTAVRDPISHFLSGYNEIEYRFKHEAESALPDFKCRTCTYVRKKYGSKERFSRFVADLLHQPPEMSRHWSFRHVYPMSRILPTLRTRNVTLDGYLPSIQNLSTAWPAFLGEQCPSFPSHVANTEMGILGQHKSSQDVDGTYKAAQDVWSDEGPVARALCIVHAMDYACWRNLPGGIPDLCQRVYASDAFAEQIMLQGNETSNAVG